MDESVANDYTFVEYIWTDCTSTTVRGKTKVIKGKIKGVEDLDWWTYDGSSTG
jgi:glutamine synthetase